MFLFLDDWFLRNAHDQCTNLLAKPLMIALQVVRTSFGFHLGWLNTVLRAVIGNSRDGACFNLDKQTWQRKKQWTTEDDFSKSPH